MSITLARRLACLLASYEMDEPHAGKWADQPQHYPDFDWPTLEKWLGEEHGGDCINMPAPCHVCFAVDAWHKAQWIAERLGGAGK